MSNGDDCFAAVGNSVTRRPWCLMMAAEMISTLMREDHESLARLLADLRIALDQPDTQRAFHLLDLFWARLAVHIRAENTCLFPAILNAPSEQFTRARGLPTISKARETIARLRSDHNLFMDELSRAVKAMRSVLGDTDESNTSVVLERVRHSLVKLAAGLAEHNALEENAVYEWPLALFTESELDRMRDSVRLEIENIPPRFEEGLRDQSD